MPHFDEILSTLFHSFVVFVSPILGYSNGSVLFTVFLIH